MKKLLILTSLLVFILPSNAQDIKVRRVKKLQIEPTVYHAEFGSSNQEIILQTTNKKEVSLINPRNNDIQTIPTPSQPILQAKVSGNKILIQENNKTIHTLQPAGDTYYIWTSISPDKKHILFTAIRKGTFICDFNGNIIKKLGKLNAPSWINNDWVLGMDDMDDGHVMTASEITAIHLGSGKKVELTSKTDEIAIYPKASPDAKRILFHNPKGEIFTSKIKLKN